MEGGFRLSETLNFTNPKKAAIYQPLKLREELDAELPKSVGLNIYYAGRNKTSYYEQNESLDTSGLERPGKQADHNESYVGNGRGAGK